MLTYKGKICYHFIDISIVFVTTVTWSVSQKIEYTVHHYVLFIFLNDCLLNNVNSYFVYTGGDDTSTSSGQWIGGIMVGVVIGVLVIVMD